MLAVLCFAGGASISRENATLVRGGSLVWTTPAAFARPMTANPGTALECLLLSFPRPWLEANVSSLDTVPAPDLQRVLASRGGHATATRPLPDALRAWAKAFMPAHLCDGARRLLDAARLTEFFLQHAYAPAPETRAPLCSRTQRLAVERVERVKAALRERLDEPPPLHDLAAIAGCAPHYLSRTFTQVEGVTLSLWLRRQRIEQAARLIAAGRCNVSEAAIEVGYISHSHFSRAFRAEKGVAPSQWISSLRAAS